MHQTLMRGFCASACLFILAPLIAAQDTANQERMQFSLPQAPWTMTLPGDNFKLAKKQMKPDGMDAYFHLTDEKQGLNVSMYIEPANRCTTSKSCRDMVWKMGNPAWANLENLVLSQIGDVSCIEFQIPSFQGRPVQQQNMYAEFVVNGFWVDLHISKVLYKPEDHKLFERIITSIKFELKNPKSVV